jgi:hypothetical protein
MKLQEKIRGASIVKPLALERLIEKEKNQKV